MFTVLMDSSVVMWPCFLSAKTIFHLVPGRLLCLKLTKEITLDLLNFPVDVLEPLNFVFDLWTAL